MRVVVTGGAGYIGSHMLRALSADGHEVISIDDFSTGYRDAVEGFECRELSLLDRTAITAALADIRPDIVMHFAARIRVGESVVKPNEYYAVNVVGSLNLLEAMRAAGVRRFVYSSSAAIFGEPAEIPITEACAKGPLNPYGSSKWIVETMLADYDRAYGLRSACLRYFNAAGAHPDGGIGERHEPETHLIPLVLQVAGGTREHLVVFGRDYDTPDGTCVRDYVHVVDLCDAHLRAMRWLDAEDRSGQFNLGNGNGFSVQQVIDTAREVTGHAIPTVDGERRPGDPARLVADSTTARRVLGWTPRYPDLRTMIEHAWAFEISRSR